MTPVTLGYPVSPDDSGTPCADGSASHGAGHAKSCLPPCLYAGGKGLIALVALWLLSGCGGLAFTGGSIPPGGAGGGSRLVGRIAKAEDPRKSLVGATVQVETRPVTGGVYTLTQIAVDGTFNFPNIQTGSTTAKVTVTVTPVLPPDPKDARQSQQVVFQATHGVTDDLVVSLPLQTFDVTQVASVTLGDITTVQPKQTTVIHAHLLDSGNNPLPVEPTLLYAGNFGQITNDSLFTPIAPGTGTVTAFWYSLPSVTKLIVAAPVDSNPNLPPPPPALPDVPPFLNSVPDVPATH